MKCEAKKCFFNKNNTCTKEKIEINGLFAVSKLGTFCFSFVNSRVCLIRNYIPKENKVVKCDADECRYNKDGFCECDHLVIGDGKSNYRTETECESFERKQNA